MKCYNDINVYDAANQRIEYIFNNFENIYVSFSGGKDSGVMLNLVFDYMRKNKINRKIGLLFIDLEAFYTKTIDFIDEMFLNNADLIIPYWVCLPMITTNAVSMYEPFWIFWEESKKEKWVRPMPSHEFIINYNNQMFEFYHDKITFESFVVKFGEWYASKHGNTACLVGIRTDESLNRFRAIAREHKGTFNNIHYSTKIADNVYNFYPIYDWNVEDIWIYNGKFNKPYNKLYDLFYKAGVSLHKMRVCEPFGDEQKAGLNLFKVVEPGTWLRVVDRVSGANFGNIYCGTKATGSKKIQLPKGHTWRSYCKFLLKTLPDETRKVYVQKFTKFIKYWTKQGSPLPDNYIHDLESTMPNNIINTGSYSNRGIGDKIVIKFNCIPDETPNDNKSWKRMCMAILKNDITCQSLSFSITKNQIVRQNELISKYKSIL